MAEERPAIGIPIRLPSDGPPAADVLVDAVLDLFDSIVELVRASGAEPVLLGPDLTGIEECLGFVVPGGGDVAPELYGGAAEDPTLWGVSRVQDDLDGAVIRFALERQRPVLGICRGMQLLNVLHGGSLHVDLAESSVVHSLPLADEFELAVHEVRLVEGTRCAAAYGFAPAIPVTSGHHQAVSRVGEGLRVTALAPDGLVEGIESEDPAGWAVGVQWHPEVASPGDGLRLPLFVALRDAARGADGGPGRRRRTESGLRSSVVHRILR